MCFAVFTVSTQRFDRCTTCACCEQNPLNPANVEKKKKKRRIASKYCVFWHLRLIRGPGASARGFSTFCVGYLLY